MSESILTVVTPALTHDLTVLTTVKDELGITDNASDARLARWIRECSGLIAIYCNRTLAQETVTEVFRPPTWGRRFRRNELSPSLILDRTPVSEISAVSIDGGAALTEGTDYELDQDAGLLSRLCNSNRSEWFACSSISVTYTGGYVLMGTLPYPIEQACLTLIKHRASARGRDPMLRSQNVVGVLEETFWVGAVGDNGAIPPEAAAMLDPYRRMPI